MLACPVTNMERASEAFLQLRTDQRGPIDLLKTNPHAGNATSGLEQLRGIIKMNQCDTRIVFIHIHLEDCAHFESPHSGE